MQYSFTFCSRPEEPSDIISGVVLDEVCLNVHVICGDSRSNIVEFAELHATAEATVM